MNIAGKEKEVTLFSGSYGRCGVQIACLIAKLTNAAKIFNSSPALNGPHNRITYISISIGIRVGLAGFEAFALLNVLATANRSGDSTAMLLVQLAHGTNLRSMVHGK